MVSVSSCIAPLLGATRLHDYSLGPSRARPRGGLRASCVAQNETCLTAAAPGAWHVPGTAVCTVPGQQEIHPTVGLEPFVFRQTVTAVSTSATNNLLSVVEHMYIISTYII